MLLRFLSNVRNYVTT